jgi:hypothetical protein
MASMISDYTVTNFTSHKTSIPGTEIDVEEGGGMGRTSNGMIPQILLRGFAVACAHEAGQRLCGVQGEGLFENWMGR